MSSSENKEMNAIFYNDYGEYADVLKKGPLPIPQPKQGEVQVKVYASSVNPIDWSFVQGKLKSSPVLPLRVFPCVPGFDVAGVVSAVGAGVDSLKVGDEVFGTVGIEANGTYSEYAVLPAGSLSLKPKNMNWTDAASIPIVFLTSYQALIDNVKQGSKVLILGGGGGCGSIGIQIAKALGAWVATTASGSKADFVKSIGADQVVDYTAEKWEEKLKGAEFDVVFEAVADQDAFERAGAVLKKGGVFVTIILYPPKQSPDYVFKVLYASPEKASTQLTAAARWAEEGKLKAVVARVYDFTVDQVVEMFKVSAAGRVQGKLALKIR